MTSNRSQDLHRYLSSTVLILVEPRASFHEWLSTIPGKTAWHKEENGAYLLPSDGRLGTTKFGELVERLKPIFLSSELLRVRDAQTHFPDPVDATSFDKYFLLLVRDHVVDAQLLSPETLEALQIEHSW
jgi:hypothetical protein